MKGGEELRYGTGVMSEQRRPKPQESREQPEAQKQPMQNRQEDDTTDMLLATSGGRLRQLKADVRQEVFSDTAEHWQKFENEMAYRTKGIQRRSVIYSAVGSGLVVTAGVVLAWLLLPFKGTEEIKSLNDEVKRTAKSSEDSGKRLERLEDSTAKLVEAQASLVEQVRSLNEKLRPHIENGFVPGEVREQMIRLESSMSRVQKQVEQFLEKDLAKLAGDQAAILLQTAELRRVLRPFDASDPLHGLLRRKLSEMRAYLSIPGENEPKATQAGSFPAKKRDFEYILRTLSEIEALLNSGSNGEARNPQDGKETKQK